MSRIRPRGINQYDATRLQGANNYYNLINNKYNTSLTDNNFIPSGNNISIQPNNIITNGLVLYLDAAIGNSYPRSGTTWFDLSGNRNNGTLTNGPTFNSGNQGSIVFDGVDDYISIGSQSIVGSGSAPMTVNLWFYNTKTLSNGQYFMLFRVRQTTEFFIPIYFTGGIHYIYPSFRGETQWATPVTYSDYQNQWICLTVVYTGGGKSTASSFETYRNGIKIPTGTTNLGPAGGGGSNCNIIGADGSSGCNTTAGYINGNLGIYQLYSRALSAEEIAQNFNATRGRFGI